MKSNNSNLSAAKAAKNDEFYTRLYDIEMELKHYKDHFKGKVIYCNCDDARHSNFHKYFALNFNTLGLKKLISTAYKADGQGVCHIYEGDDDEVKVTPLKGDGDFRSEECVELLKEADIVVTNPPFSLFREFVAQLVEYGKQFIIIGNMNAITYKEIFPLIKDNKMWLGHKDVKEFVQPNGEIKKFGNIGWFTNLPTEKRNQPIDLYKHYNPEEYPKYDNYDAIEVSKVADIPMDYDGVMGVPITFLNKYCPTQFEIVAQMDNTKVDENNFGYPFVNGEKKYARILIKRV